MVQEDGWVERDMTEQSKVTKQERIARSQCAAALGIGEPAGKMGYMDCPQAENGKVTEVQIGA